MVISDKLECKFLAIRNDVIDLDAIGEPGLY